jgi:solute carrier family 38 (sodium-coupled neutral amino acid transporter), member 11
MFTTLPLELFVCREVLTLLSPPSTQRTDEWLLAQVIEQYFFSHEAFNMQRHVFFTTVILFSSMFGASVITYPHSASTN